MHWKAKWLLIFFAFLSTYSAVVVLLQIVPDNPGDPNYQNRMPIESFLWGALGIVLAALVATRCTRTKR